MLTSGANQYLRPEYLTPLPTTLDAKKSPLALLAQTCSQIGADSNSSKLSSSLDKHKKTENIREREKVSPASSIGSNISTGENVSLKSGFKLYEIQGKDESLEDRGSAGSSSRARTPSSKSSSSNTPVLVNGNRCGSNHSSSSPRSSPMVNSRKTPASSAADTKPLTTQPMAVPRSVSSPSSKVGFASSLFTSTTDPLLKDLPLGTFKPGAGLPIPAGLVSGYPTSGTPFPLDIMASSFLSPHALKSGLNPYLNLARIKSPSGAETVVTPCRDPYCTGCQLNAHLVPNLNGKPGQCPGGCAQCDHTTKASSFLPSASGTAAAAAAYAHAQLAALAAASQLPYVCNWIASDAAYCGKRFSDSEELLQHLKSHTSVTNSDNSNSTTLSLLNSSPNLPLALPLLHRNYPTPPLSPLATARYHPYSKNPLVPTFPSLSFPLHPHPGLSPYLSPYALYGQRLGASGMHP